MSRVKCTQKNRPLVSLWLIMALFSALLPIYLIHSIICKVNYNDFDKIDQIGNTSKGEVFYEELIPREIITDYLVADGFLFVLYKDSCLVNVYTTDGKYQYSLRYGDLTQNGRAYIGYLQGTLHIQACNGNIYTFKDAQYKGCMKQTSISIDLKKKINLLCSSNSDREYQGVKFFADGNTIQSYDGDIINVVVSFPKVDNEEVKDDVLVLPVALALTGTLFEKYFHIKKREINKTGDGGVS